MPIIYRGSPGLVCNQRQSCPSRSCKAYRHFRMSSWVVLAFPYRHFLACRMKVIIMFDPQNVCSHLVLDVTLRLRAQPLESEPTLLELGSITIHAVMQNIQVCAYLSDLDYVTEGFPFSQSAVHRFWMLWMKLWKNLSNGFLMNEYQKAILTGCKCSYPIFLSHLL